MPQDALIAPIREWLVDRALCDNDVVELFETLCQRISGVGIPIKRARLVWPTLHPLFQAETVVWNQGEPARLEQFVHQDNESDEWITSPMKHMVETGLEVFRRRLVGDQALLDFGMLEELRGQGFTDYLAHATHLEGYHVRARGTMLAGDNPASKGVIVTWASDRPEGFHDEDIYSLHKIQRRFAVTCKVIIQSRIARNISTTYLGNRAGENVLRGQIRRGDGQTTSAVVWYSDLRNSTSLAESMPRDDYFSMLNAYFEATAEPVVENGGEILDFIGDAVLGIFPYSEKSELKDAAKAANSAIEKTLARAFEVNQARGKIGEEQFKFGVGLNVGDVMFGNIGIPSRLTFSVIGPTVNEVARIEQMTKLLQQPVLSAANFANLDPVRWKSMGEHKLDGVLEPLELFSFQSAKAA